ncbi:MAG: 4Fe-4S binding protein [Candidatus Omnitrophica bacterium]|nr:4Fe-4S binding protein [Candidatus Omnitrophota bacterium]MBU0881490.1 4Fe-4S binding protein [Candidatus Omnitrophota bacterium]MBU1808379.1 4Fe-4S binding protein [Candidatus Omnitrophota bacterium]
MAKRKIIKIDDRKCNGCGECIPNCPEGAIQIIDDKARLISDLFCDGLGACIGHCPQGAITIEEREATPYDEKKVMANIVKHGRNTISAHLKHLKEHNEAVYLNEAMGFLKDNKIEVPHDEKQAHASHGVGCPGSRVIEIKKAQKGHSDSVSGSSIESELRQWPVQIMLVPVSAPYFDGADLLIAADCVPFAYANFHRDLLKGRILLVGCPKLDDLALYGEKLSAIIKNNNIKSVTNVHMEVPCCYGLISVIKDAIVSSKKNIPFKDITITIAGEKRE